MKSRTKSEDMQTIFLIKQGEIGRQKAGELSRKLTKMLSNPEFLAAVEQRMQEKAKQNAAPEQEQTVAE